MSKVILKKLIILIILSLNLFSSNVSKKQCENKKGDFIYTSGECIQFYKSDGDAKNSIILLIHGTWPAGTNILARYSIFAQDLSLQTDITTIAVALPGYSGSSTNNFKALVHENKDNSDAKKKYIKFLSSLVESLKKKFNAKIVTYIGHSAGATIGAKLATTSSNLLNNIVLVGGKYDINSQDLDKMANYLLIYGTKDKVSKPSVTKEFYKQTKKANLNVQIVEIQDAVHLDLDMQDGSVDAIIELVEVQ